MNKLIIPPAPNWYESNSISCAIDNTVVYGSRSEIVIIHPKPPTEPADIQIIFQSHADRVTSVALNPNWGEGNKLIVSAGEDKVVHLWNAETSKLMSSHKAHTTRLDRLVGASFAGNDKIVSISEDGAVMIWRFVNNEVNSVSSHIGRDKVTCLSICPHASWVAAIGTRKGIITILDLRKGGTVLRRLNDHDNSSICALSWCPTPYNVFPNKVQQKADANVALQPESESNIKEDTINGDDLPESSHKEQDEQNSSSELPEVDSHAEHIEPIENEVVSSVVTKLVETETTIASDASDVSSDNLITKEIALDPDCTQTENNIKDAIVDLNEPCNENDNATSINVEPLKSQNSNTTDDASAPSENNKTENFRTEYLLASASRSGRSVVIWNTYKGLKQIYLRLSNNKLRGKSQTSIWIAVHWYRPKSLLLSSLKGELLQWNLNSSSKENKTTVVHNNHDNLIFNIVSPMRKYESPDDEDWRDNNLLNAWTFSRDRLLINTSLSADRKTLALYPSFANVINCLVASPVDPTRVAIASADGSCRLWDLSQPHIQCIVITPVWEKIHTKVMTAAWHPTKESILACGTVEGKVLLIDTGNRSKPPTYLIQHSGLPVHNLQWGPLNGDVDNIGLYCNCDGKLIVYDSNKILKDPSVIDVCSNEFVTRSLWKPDYSKYAVGTKQGNVHIFSTSCQPLGTLSIHQKGIKYLAWHPEATAENSSVSSCASWLAVAAEKVFIYDCSLLEVEDCEDKYAKCIVAEFSDHTSNVICLVWSPHAEGKLASASCDGSALVWDVKSKTLLYCCRQKNLVHFTTVFWSPLDPDYLITGNRDSIIQIWKLSENLPQEKIDKKERRKLLQQTTTPVVIEGAIDENKNKRVKRRYVLAGLAHLQSALNPNQLDLCKEIYNTVCDATAVAPNEQPSEEDGVIKISQLFGTKDDLDKVLELEKAVSSQNKISTANNYISLWQGDIKERIKNAISTKTLSPWFIQMAPMVSHSLWQEACEVYAKQLSEAPNPPILDISSYYLACHKIDEAIDVLCEGLLFREALALAKCRLLPDDPHIPKIIEQWAEYCSTTGNIEVGVQGYLALGKLSEAASVLSKRSDEESLKYACHLAEKALDLELKETIIYKLSKLNEDKEELPPELPSRAELELALQSQKNTIETQNLSDSTDPVTDGHEDNIGKIDEVKDEQGD